MAFKKPIFGKKQADLFIDTVVFFNLPVKYLFVPWQHSTSIEFLH